MVTRGVETKDVALELSRKRQEKKKLLCGVAKSELLICNT